MESASPVKEEQTQLPSRTYYIENRFYNAVLSPTAARQPTPTGFISPASCGAGLARVDPTSDATPLCAHGATAKEAGLPSLPSIYPTKADE